MPQVKKPIKTLLEDIKYKYNELVDVLKKTPAAKEDIMKRTDELNAMVADLESQVRGHGPAMESDLKIFVEKAKSLALNKKIPTSDDSAVFVAVYRRLKDGLSAPIGSRPIRK